VALPYNAFSRSPVLWFTGFPNVGRSDVKRHKSGLRLSRIELLTGMSRGGHGQVRNFRLQQTGGRPRGNQLNPVTDGPLGALKVDGLSGIQSRSLSQSHHMSTLPAKPQRINLPAPRIQERYTLSLSFTAEGERREAIQPEGGESQGRGETLGGGEPNPEARKGTRAQNHSDGYQIAL
jgi:hypothetical protein